MPDPTKGGCDMTQEQQEDRQPLQNRAEHPLEKVIGTTASEDSSAGAGVHDDVPESPEAKLTREESAFDAELAQEVAPPWPHGERNAADERRRADDGLGGQGLGWTGIVLSILAFFMFPVILGIAGVAFGYFSYRQGAHTLGIWAMVLGGLAVLGALLFSPYFVR